MGKNKQQTNYWTLSTEDYRLPYPRVKIQQKRDLSPTEWEFCKQLFDEGHYGSGVYNVSDPEADDARKDIEWKDVDRTDNILVPVSDVNSLAMGGIPIESIEGPKLKVRTASSLWGDGSKYFSYPNTNKNRPYLPAIQKGDIVQIAGCRGMQELNGRVFRIGDMVKGDTALEMSLFTMDGSVYSGPSSHRLVEDREGNLLYVEVGGKQAADLRNFSEYEGGGVIIPHNPHWMLSYKAQMRERFINIGSPHPETGETLKAAHWNQPSGDYNATYPFNHVYETESGHIMEYDDTPGAERIHQWHRSGTHYEIDHNGTRTNYVKGDNYDIRLHEDYMYVKGKVVHTYDDEVLIRYNDRADISAKWKLQIWSGGDLDIHSKRNINMKADGDINMQADGHINLHGTGLTPRQTDTMRAGTRNAKERSKIKLKAAHLEVEMIGDETKPEQYGITLQSNQSGIMVKTLLGGDKNVGDINIAAAEDMN